MDSWSTAKMAAQVAIVVFILAVIQLVLAQHDGDLRLVQGTSSRNGRVEIYRNSEWVAIYDGGGFGLREATVACRQLGFTNSEDGHVYRGGTFGSGTSSVRLESVHCDGGEEELMQCSYTICSEDDCSHDSDVGISCGSGEDQQYIPRGTGYRGWSGFIFLFITIPFCGHAYRRRRNIGQHSRSIIPIPRYHHGRVPLTSALDDPGMTTPPGDPTHSYPNSPQDLPPEPVAQVFTHGYVYPPSSITSPVRPTAAVPPTPACDTTNASLQYHSPGRALVGQPIGSGQPLSLAFPRLPPPEYSEHDQGATSPISSTVTENFSDSAHILDPPPKYEDVVKT